MRSKLFLLANGEGSHVASRSLGELVDDAAGEGALRLVSALLSATCESCEERRPSRREGEESTALGCEIQPRT